MPKVEIYTKSTCGYCALAKRLLDAKNASYLETELHTHPDKYGEMIERSYRRTVPQVFIDGQHIGGFDDLSALDRAGRLDELLAA